MPESLVCTKMCIRDSFYGKMGKTHIGSPFCNVFVVIYILQETTNMSFLLLHYILQSTYQNKQTILKQEVILKDEIGR